MHPYGFCCKNCCGTAILSFCKACYSGWISAHPFAGFDNARDNTGNAGDNEATVMMLVYDCATSICLEVRSQEVWEKPGWRVSNLVRVAAVLCLVRSWPRPAGDLRTAAREAGGSADKQSLEGGFSNPLAQSLESFPCIYSPGW